MIVQSRQLMQIRAYSLRPLRLRICKFLRDGRLGLLLSPSNQVGQELLSSFRQSFLRNEL